MNKPEKLKNLEEAGDYKLGHNEAIDEMQAWFEWLIDEEIKELKQYQDRAKITIEIPAITKIKIEALQELKRKVKDE